MQRKNLLKPEPCSANHPPAPQLPDASVCRAKRAGTNGSIFCLVPDPHGCQHAKVCDCKIFCRHPEPEAILKATKF